MGPLFSTGLLTPFLDIGSANLLPLSGGSARGMARYPVAFFLSAVFFALKTRKNGDLAFYGAPHFSSKHTVKHRRQSIFFLFFI